MDDLEDENSLTRFMYPWRVFSSGNYQAYIYHSGWNNDRGTGLADHASTMAPHHSHNYILKL